MSLSTPGPHPLPAWLALVQNQIETLRYGVVQVVVHDSRVIQIERTEKLRFDKDVKVAPPAASTVPAPPVKAEESKQVTSGSSGTLK